MWDAPADITFAAACEMDVLQSPIIRAIFKTREVLLGSEPDTAVRPRGLLASTTSMGWGVLAEVPGREVVMGAVTQPWQANVTFRALPPDEFAAFNEPGYVKIAWTLRADPIGATQSIFRTETRALATNAVARTKFRRYWSFLSPGIIAIRRIMLTPVKADAERRATSDSRNHASAADAGATLGGVMSVATVDRISIEGHVSPGFEAVPTRSLNFADGASWAAPVRVSTGGKS